MPFALLSRFEFLQHYTAHGVPETRSITSARHHGYFLRRIYGAGVAWNSRFTGPRIKIPALGRRGMPLPPCLVWIIYLEDTTMPGWLFLVCGIAVVIAAAYLLYAVLRPEDF